MDNYDIMDNLNTITSKTHNAKKDSSIIIDKTSRLTTDGDNDAGSNPWNFPSPFTAAALAGTSGWKFLLVVESTVIYENTEFLLNLLEYGHLSDSIGS